MYPANPLTVSPVDVVGSVDSVQVSLSELSETVSVLRVGVVGEVISVFNGVVTLIVVDLFDSFVAVS